MLHNTISLLMAWCHACIPSAHSKASLLSFVNSSGRMRAWRSCFLSDGQPQTGSPGIETGRGKRQLFSCPTNNFTLTQALPIIDEALSLMTESMWMLHVGTGVIFQHGEPYWRLPCNTVLPDWRAIPRGRLGSQRRAAGQTHPARW